MQTIGRSAYNSSNPDTTGFFESNTNLIKGLALLEKLREYGLTYDQTLNQTTSTISAIGAAKTSANNIMMSRVKNSTPPPGYEGDAFNRTRTVIAAEAESWNCDMFISIHSNAATEGSSTNYPLFEFRGTDNNPYVATSDVMAQTVWPYLYNIVHMRWNSSYSLTKMNIRGDISFGGSTVYGNGYPGYLGVLMSNVPGFLVEGYFHTYQPARQRAMNWDVDRQEGVAYARGIAAYYGLSGETTGDIYGIVRDQDQLFTDNLYTPASGSNDIYLPLNGVKVTLTQNGSTVATYTTDNEYNGAFVFAGLQPGSYTMTFTHSNYATYSESVTVTAANTTYPIVFLSNSAADYDTYPDEAAGSVTPAWQYNMEQEYVDNAISELSGKTIRRTVLNGDNLYILALDSSNDPTIIVYDTANKKVLANVSTSGMTGDYLNV
ncbi:MAG: carboxypeptidase regulatory-like domain-containing protein [Clostridia bacterium]|nr:carboxypeptidase regulatory-like domain-containing protein [Clostridia bacterium]